MITSEGKWIIGLIMTGFTLLGSNVVANDRLRVAENTRIESDFNNKSAMLWRMIDDNYKDQMRSLSIIIDRLSGIEAKQSFNGRR